MNNNMIEEIIAFFLSIVSLFTSEAPPLSRRNDEVVQSASAESEENALFWRDRIHREYERENERLLSGQVLGYLASPSYVSVGNELRAKPSLCQSIQRGLRASLAIMLAVFPVGLFGIALLYFDMNTTNLCLEWKHNNNSMPLAVMRLKLIGEDIQAILIFIWFPVTLILVFGWTEFKSHHIASLYLSFATGATVVIYETFLLVFGVFGTDDYYRYPANVLFVVNICWGSIIVARNIHSRHHLTSRLRIFSLISFGFIAGVIIAYAYRYAIVPCFNQLEEQSYRVLVAAIAPVVALLPTAICKRMIILQQNSEIIQPEQGYLLLYCLRGATSFVYRIMQADFNSIWLFIALSLFSGLSNVARQATRQIRGKIWTRIVGLLKKTFCCRRLEKLPLNTPQQRRLKADIEIQNILSGYNALIMSQVYLFLYRVTNFEISVWPVLKQSLVRISIGLAIDFVFNCLSIFIQIHSYDIPIRRVWLKYWKRHTVANAILLGLIVCYFTSILLTVFQIRTDKSAEIYPIKNCTLPFTSR